MARLVYFVALVAILTPLRCFAAEPSYASVPADGMLEQYFRQETARLQELCLAEIKSLDDWQERQPELRNQLFEMLGLDPLPERTDLRAQVTGSVEHDEFRVERLHFQSRPGLYVTGNLYLPRKIEGRLPAVLYVCGHGLVKKDGISYGNKVYYQHHGAWFARNGYVCLVIDTLQLGEIEGIHHGTYRYDMWWWLNHGYTPAGVEAWNCIRALDYLQSRPEVDGDRLGVTGRSGGGAYSWWIAAIDDRIKAAVPVAGITDLADHVVDGCVEGHCDCMYFVNTYEWDYPGVAALVAPRPLLISNTDRDPIFPLDGVVRIYERASRIYGLHDAHDRCGLNITAGGHDDTQELQVHALRWLNRHLKDGDDSLIQNAAMPYLEPEQLKVFDKLPDDERNTRIHEEFVKLPDAPCVPQDQAAWDAQRRRWLDTLQAKSFRGWPDGAGQAALTEICQAKADGVRLMAYELDVQPAVRLRAYALMPADDKQPAKVALHAADQQEWDQLLASLRAKFAEHLGGEELPAADEGAWQRLADRVREGKEMLVYLAPRGIGPSRWTADERKQTQIERRFYLLGQTLDGMRVYDIRRAIQAVRSTAPQEGLPLEVHAGGRMAGNALYATLFEPGVSRLELTGLPTSHRDGPFYLNVSRVWEMPQAVAVAAERSEVVLHEANGEDWKYVNETAAALGWDEGQVKFGSEPAKTNAER